MVVRKTTRASLLSRVRDLADEVAWQSFEAAYREMLVGFCRSRGIQHADAEDVVQLVMTKLVSGLHGFRYDPEKGRFRDYLFRCARSAIADLKSCPKGAPRSVEDIEEPGEENEAAKASWEREWVDHHYRLAIEEVRAGFEERSVSVFEAILAGQSVRDVATSTGMSEAAVHKVLQRVRARLKEQIAEQVRLEERFGR